MAYVSHYIQDDAGKLGSALHRIVIGDIVIEKAKASVNVSVISTLVSIQT